MGEIDTKLDKQYENTPLKELADAPVAALQGLSEDDAEKLKDALIRAIPFRRLAKPEETAAAITFFASSQSDYVTAQVLSVSGGLTMVG